MKKQYNQPIVNIVEMMPQMAVLTTSNYSKKEDINSEVVFQW